MWDGISCWPPTPVRAVAVLKCPQYVDGFNENRWAHKECMPKGTWYVNELTGKAWTNYSQCTQTHSTLNDQRTEMQDEINNKTRQIRVCSLERMNISNQCHIIVIPASHSQLSNNNAHWLLHFVHLFDCGYHHFNLCQVSSIVSKHQGHRTYLTLDGIHIGLWYNNQLNADLFVDVSDVLATVSTCR